MTRARLQLLLRLLRVAGTSRTVAGVLGLWLLVSGVAGHLGLIGPNGLLDLRLWISGHIVSGQDILGTFCAALALYGRSEAKGPLLALAKAALPLPTTTAALLESPQRPAEDTQTVAPAAVQPAGLRPTAGQLVASAGTLGTHLVGGLGINPGGGVGGGA